MASGDQTFCWRVCRPCPSCAAPWSIAYSQPARAVCAGSASGRRRCCWRGWRGWDPGDTALLAEAKAIEDRRRAEEKARRPPPREPAARVGHHCACFVLLCASQVSRRASIGSRLFQALGRTCPAGRFMAMS